MDISLWLTKWVDAAQCLTFVSLLILYTIAWLLLVISKICRVVPSWGQSKYMFFCYFMKGTSIRCFRLVDYAGANVDLLNGYFFVQIWSVLAEISHKVMSLENWPSLTNFPLPSHVKKLADNFWVRRLCSFLHI